MGIAPCRSVLASGREGQGPRAKNGLPLLKVRHHDIRSLFDAVGNWQNPTALRRGSCRWIRGAGCSLGLLGDRLEIALDIDRAERGAERRKQRSEKGKDAKNPISMRLRNSEDRRTSKAEYAMQRAPVMPNRTCRTVMSSSSLAMWVAFVVWYSIWPAISLERTASRNAPM